jgi:hypothetical protein
MTIISTTNKTENTPKQNKTKQKKPIQNKTKQNKTKKNQFKTKTTKFVVVILVGLFVVCGLWFER